MARQSLVSLPLASVALALGLLSSPVLATGHEGASVSPMADTAESHYVQSEVGQLRSLSRWLNLTNEQNAMLEQVIKDTLERINDLQRPDPLPILEQPTFNRSMARQKLQARNHWQIEIQVEVMEAFYTIYQKLDAKQQQKFRDAFNWHVGYLPHNEDEIESLPFMKHSG